MQLITFYRLSDEDIRSVKQQYGIVDETAELKKMLACQQEEIQIVQKVMSQQYHQIQSMQNRISRQYEQMQNMQTMITQQSDQIKNMQNIIETMRLNSAKSNKTEPVPVQKTDWSDFEYECEDGFIKISGYKGKNIHITVPYKIEGMIVRKIARLAFWTNKNVKAVTIPKSVYIIGDKAFPAGTVICCEKGSYAEQYARKNNISVSYI